MVHLLTIDASVFTGNPLHIRRFVNSYGEDGTGVKYQGNQFEPFAYKLDTVDRSTKSTKQGVKIQITDPNYEFTRFIDSIGGSLEGARVYEYKVYERFLDNGIEANINAYVKRVDHEISFVTTEKKGHEFMLSTTDPLSRDIDVPTIQFSAGVPNDTESHINVFPAVNRAITRGR
jgi:phage-related protein